MDQHRPLVFISYASLDRGRVDPFADSLEQAGVDVWMDYRRLKAGQNWNTEIRRALGKAAVIVIFMSENSVDRRGYAQREIKIAIEQAEEKLVSDIYIIPILLDDLPEYPEAVKHLHMIRASSADAGGQLLDALNHQLEKLGAHVQAIQSETNIRWTERIIKENWDGLPGYEFEYNLFHLSSPDFPQIGDITTIIHGYLAELCASERSVKFEQNTEYYNFGQKKFFRTRTLEAHCRQPAIVGRVISLIYSNYRYSGGAHGNYNFHTYVFTLDPLARVYPISQIFSDANESFSKIQRLAREQLINDLSAADGLPPEDHREWVNGGTEKWSDFEAFALAEGGIEIIFPPYQVAAYAYGPQTVILDKNEIHDLLRPEFLSALGWENLRWQAEHQTMLSEMPTNVAADVATVEKQA